MNAIRSVFLISQQGLKNFFSFFLDLTHTHAHAHLHMYAAEYYEFNQINAESLAPTNRLL